MTASNRAHDFMLRECVPIKSVVFFLVFSLLPSFTSFRLWFTFHFSHGSFGWFIPKTIFALFGEFVLMFVHRIWYTIDVNTEYGYLYSSYAFNILRCVNFSCVRCTFLSSSQQRRLLFSASIARIHRQISLWALREIVSNLETIAEQHRRFMFPKCFQYIFFQLKISCGRHSLYVRELREAWEPTSIENWAEQ